MASCTSVQVLCPNGRRQNVKVTPSTTLLQALEEVCKKQNFLPPEEYNLIHGRKVLDLTLTIRFANLSNNAKLELVKSKTPRAFSDVLIALQLENGERLQHKFSPNCTLWEILQHWDSQRGSGLCTIDESSHPPRHPVCIYLGEETVGEFALREMTLKKLGLTGGKAIIRMIHRAVDDSIIARSIESIDKEKHRQARIDEQSTLTQSISDTQSSLSEAMETDDSSLSIEYFKQSSGSSGPCEASKPNHQPIAAQPTQTSQPGPSKKRQALTPSPSQPSTSLDTSSASTSDALSAIEAIPGVQVFRPSDFYDLSPQEQEIARRLAQRLMPQLGLTPAQTPQSIQPQAFNDFKFPEATKGQSLYQNEFSEVNRTEFQPCDRETVVFSADEPRSSSSVEDLPDDFFEVTENDVKNMLVDYQNKLQSMNDQPLMTQALRQQLVERKVNRYQRVVIRVQFPDRFILQGLFKPRETVFAVQKFVKEHLEDKSVSFHLYTSPPKQVLRDISKTLTEANLVPATVVYFSSDVKKDHYLSQAVLQEVSSLREAEVIVARTFQGQTDGEEANQPSTSQGQNEASTSRGNSEPSSSKGKTPKWFLKGKK